MEPTPPEKRAHAAVLAFIAGYVDANTWMRFETFGGAPCVAIGATRSSWPFDVALQGLESRPFPRAAD
eukprot:294180-Prymnesium_polylepis.2